MCHLSPSCVNINLYSRASLTCPVSCGTKLHFGLSGVTPVSGEAMDPPAVISSPGQCLAVLRAGRLAGRAEALQSGRPAIFKTIWAQE